MATRTYLNFDLLLERAKDGCFRVRVTSSPAGELTARQFSLPWNETQLENLLLKLDPGRGLFRRVGADSQTQAAEDLGGDLFEAVFDEELRLAWSRSLDSARNRGKGLRLRLRLTEAPAIAGLPWELLHDRRSNRFLAQSEETPLVRYLEVSEPPGPLLVNGPLRVLVVISSPTDQEELDTESEWRKITQALAKPVEEKRVHLDRLPLATMSALADWLEVNTVHVLHFIGHGDYDVRLQDGVLLFCDEYGRSEPVSPSVLGPVLHDHLELRLVVLNACRTARVDETDPFSGMAQGLIQQQAPAAVAMQFPISDRAAGAFAAKFYGAIALGRPVDQAVALARKTLLIGYGAEWATPVLFLRAPDGEIFTNIAAPPPTDGGGDDGDKDIGRKSTVSAPPAPTGLTGLVVDQVVELRWATVPDAVVTARWQVYRDGELVAEATAPTGRDRPPKPGSYAYTVVAIGADGQGSGPSEPWTATVSPARRPAPSRPTALTGAVEGQVVQLSWAASSDRLASTASWDVRRDDEFVARATSPSARDRPPVPGIYAYTIVAVAADGQRSAVSEAWTALVPPDRLPAPAVPTGLDGAVSRRVVELRWNPHSTGPTRAVRWEVRRDGALVANSGGPEVRDRVPKPGAYAYTVVAVGADSQRSAPSEEWTAVVRSRRWLLALAAAVVVVALVVGVVQLLHQNRQPTRIDVGGQPQSVAMSRDGLTAYVANYTENGSGSLSVIDTTSNAVTRTIQVPANPTAAEVGPDGKVYVSTFGAHLFVMDPSSGAGLREYSIAQTGPGLAFSPTTPVMYAANFATGVVTVIDTSRMTVVKTFNPTSNPALEDHPRTFGVAASPDGRFIYVGSPSDKTVYAVDAASTNNPRRIGLGEAWDIAVSADGRTLYAASNRANALYVVDTTADFGVKTVPLPGNAASVTLSPDGSRAYISSGSGTAIYVVDTTTNVHVRTIDVGRSTFGVAVSPDGRHGYVANRAENSVTVVDLD
jgi:YVTN family beta-propeller protein